MRFGVSTHGHGAAATQVVVAARLAAQAGFDTVGVAGPSADVVASWIAATTTRVRIRAALGAAVPADPHRWATIDALSGGRLDLAAEDPAVLAALGRAWADSTEPLLPVQSPHPPLALAGDPVRAGRHRLPLYAVVEDDRAGDLVDAYRQAWDAGRPLSGVAPSGDLTIALPVPDASAALLASVAHLATLGVAELTWRLEPGDESRRIAALAAHLPALRAEAERRHPSVSGGPAGATPPFPLPDRSLR
ncbi:hypothetical protein [Pimelobacter simplex]|uniref:hypothetical protein n=1 Tax=Nocardioides simplex TaxID=2045 RepID=UPI003AB0B315